MVVSDHSTSTIIYEARYKGDDKEDDKETWTKNKHVILQTRDLRAVHYTWRVEMTLQILIENS